MEEGLIMGDGDARIMDVSDAGRGELPRFPEDVEEFLESLA